MKRDQTSPPLKIERLYDPDRQAMLAALREVLRLRKPLPGLEEGEAR